MANLWSSLKIKNLNLANRLVMPPMALDIASETGQVTNSMIDHYTARTPFSISRGTGAQGLGLIIVEHSYVSKFGKAHPRQLGIYDDKQIPGLKKLADCIHKTGVPVGIQLSHAGARGMEYTAGPSSIPVPFLHRFAGGESLDDSLSTPADIPRQMGTREILQVVEDFAQGAARAQMAGFDLVEIHGAHGYLLNQFFSPLTNQRTDEYGGTLVNRLRLSLEIIHAIRDTVGADFPVFYRLGADDLLPGGNEIGQGAAAAKILENAGVDCLDISGGLGGYLRSGPEGFFGYMADAIKAVTEVPVLLTGGIKTAGFANQMVVAGNADLIGVGRTLLTDPDWANRAWLSSH